MRYLFLLFVALTLISRASAQPAAEKTEKRLTELSTPTAKVRSTVLDKKPVVWKSSATLEVFIAPQKLVNAPPIRLQSPPIKAVKPGAAPEGTPLLSYSEPVKAPKDIELPTEALIWLPSVDVNAPVAIPILSRPAKDRASLGDPALEASLEAALKPVTPMREGPVPFTPFNLPDPFENLRYGQLRNPPEENATPPMIPCTKPGTK